MIIFDTTRAVIHDVTTKLDTCVETYSKQLHVAVIGDVDTIRFHEFLMKNRFGSVHITSELGNIDLSPYNAAPEFKFAINDFGKNQSVSSLRCFAAKHKVDRRIDDMDLGTDILEIWSAQKEDSLEWEVPELGPNAPGLIHLIFQGSDGRGYDVVLMDPAKYCP